MKKLYEHLIPRMKELYWGKECSIAQIGKELNIPKGSIYCYLNSNGGTRNMKESARIKVKTGRMPLLIGEKNPSWNGGKHKSHGYILIKLYSDDFFFSMTNKKGYVFEHRLVVAKALRRCLHRWEVVHHKNRIRNDNRYENLQLVQEMQHRQITNMETRIKQLEKRVTLLEAENIVLRKGRPEYVKVD